MTASESIEHKLPTVPDMPGAYMMKDAQGAIIYVGKARSLRKRLRQHFRDNGPRYGWTQQLYAAADDIEYFVTNSEVEAFILEATLIKEHKPKYNIRLMDDKSYPYLKLTAEIYPRLVVLRDLPRDANVQLSPRAGRPRFHDPKRHEVHSAGGGRIFGPYTSAAPMWRLTKLVPQLFGLRSCRRKLDGSAMGKPCLNFHIGRCLGPCRGAQAVPAQQYAEAVEQTARLLDGKSGEIVRELEERMKAAAAELNFEQAAALRDKLQAVQKAVGEQIVVAAEHREQDVIAVATEGDKALVALLQVRGGRLLRQEQFVFAHTKGRSVGDILDAFMTRHYAETTSLPAEVLLAEDVPDIEVWADLLSEMRETKVRVHHPQRGDKRKLTELARKNARAALTALEKSRAEQHRATQAALHDLAEALGIEGNLRRIECFDISTGQGKNSVGSQVVFSDGLPDKRSYRRFRMRATEGKPDDYAMMQEALTRRLRAGLGGDERFLPLPELIVVDGGKGQLNAAVEVLKREGVGDIPVCGLAKREEEIFLPGQPEPLDMTHHQPGQFLLQRLRDEAHRFAISHHRGLQGTEVTRSVLDEIPGIGAARKRALLSKFASVQAMSRVTVDELAAVEGMNRKVAAELLFVLTGGRVEEYEEEGRTPEYDESEGQVPVWDDGDEEGRPEGWEEQEGLDVRNV